MYFLKNSYHLGNNNHVSFSRSPQKKDFISPSSQGHQNMWCRVSENDLNGRASSRVNSSKLRAECHRLNIGSPSRAAYDMEISQYQFTDIELRKPDQAAPGSQCAGSAPWEPSGRVCGAQYPPGGATLRPANYHNNELSKQG